MVDTIREIDKIEAALRFVDPHDRDTWLQAGMAIKSELGDTGFDIWNSWSAKSDNYQANSAKSTWKSIKLSKVTVGTLYWLASQQGFNLKDYKTQQPSAKEVESQQKARILKAGQDQAKLAQDHKLAAIKAQQIWDAAKPLRLDHPYLLKKQISTLDLSLKEIDANQLSLLAGYRVNVNSQPLSGRILIAPISKINSSLGDKFITSLEFIDEFGLKSALAKGEKSGAAFALDSQSSLSGPSVNSTESIYVLEGIATAASARQAYHEYTDQLQLPNAQFFAALSAGNLSAVANELKIKFPQSHIVIGGDIGNGDLLAAKAAFTVASVLAFPLGPDGLVVDSRVTDFNDLATHKGNKVVIGALLGARSPEGFGFEMVDGRVIRGDDLNHEPKIQTSPKDTELSDRPNSGIIAPLELEPIILRDFDSIDRKRAELQISSEVIKDPQSFFDLYKADPRSHQGLYVNSDLFKETFNVYKHSKESRSIYNLPVHNSAAVLAASLFRSNLLVAQTQLEQGSSTRDRVLLVTGTPGAGKSTFITSAINGEFEIATIYEGQLADVSAAKIKIDQILGKGLKPEIIAIHAKAENALDNAIQRFDQVGRGASIDLIANLLSRLPDSLEEIHQAYGDAVKLTVIDRLNPDKSTIAPGWDFLPILTSEGQYEHIKERLSNHLEQRYQSGSISSANYEQALGRAPDRSSHEIYSERSGGVGSDADGPRVSQDDAREQLLNVSPSPDLSQGLIEEPQLELKSPQSVPIGVIEDFGQKIGGARKDIWTGYLDRLKDAQNLRPKDVPFSKYWPEPNYLKLIEAGHHPGAIAYLRSVRDFVPTKPKSAYKLSSWTGKVEFAKSLAKDITEAMDRPDDLHSMLDSLKNTSVISDRAALYQIAGHEHSLSNYQIELGSYSLLDGVTYSPPKALWSIEEIAKGSSWPKQLLVADTKEDLLINFAKGYEKLLGQSQKSKESRSPEFILYRKSANASLYVGKKIGKRYIDLAGPFLDVKEAREYRNSNSEQLNLALSKLKETPTIRALANEPRLGIDYRNGQNITQQEFSLVFGFRGVEFGNWVEQGKRQDDLNEAYDALMDLSKALDLPPKSLSLNGELGLAFGARGRGGVDPAKAHYESTHIVINLTKEKGAGSLAHEWWHALDNYLVRNSAVDRPHGFVTENPKLALPDMRENLQESFVMLMDQIKRSGLPARSAKMDEFRSSVYWSTPIEMSARSFEGYIGARLGEVGIRNDYLVNYLPPKEWKSEDLARYPYPISSELTSLNESFKALFDVVKTKQTDKGIAIFQAASAGGMAEEDCISLISAAERVEQLLKPFGRTTIPVRIIDNLSDIGIKSPGFAVSGVTHQEHIFLVREGLGNVAEVEKTLWHEMLHFGLRRFLTKEDYVENLNELYNKDQWIAKRADDWINTPDGQAVATQNSDNPAYIRARGVDEALADLAEIVQTNPSGYRLNGVIDQTYRNVRTWVANLADKLGFHEAAKGWRDFAASKDARNLVAYTFSRLQKGAAPEINPRWNYSDPSFKQVLRNTDHSKEEKQFNVTGNAILPGVSNIPSPGDLIVTKDIKPVDGQTITPSKEPAIQEPTPSKTVGEPLYEMSSVPHEVRLAATAFYGSRHDHFPPRENGGPYKGEVFNTANYLVQEVNSRALVFHDKSKIEYKSEKIATLEKDSRINGLELKFIYEGDQAKVYPYDALRNNFVKVCKELNESAEIMCRPPEDMNMLNVVMTSAWERVNRERLSQLKQVTQHKEQIAPDHTVIAPAPSSSDAPTRSR